MKAGVRHFTCAVALFSLFSLAWCPLAFAAGAPDPVSLVSLVFAGDIVLDDVAGEMIQRGEDPFADLAAVFGGADIRIGNLECVVATTGSGAQRWQPPPP